MDPVSTEEPSREDYLWHFLNLETGNELSTRFTSLSWKMLATRRLKNPIGQIDAALEKFEHEGKIYWDAIDAFMKSDEVEFPQADGILQAIGPLKAAITLWQTGDQRKESSRDSARRIPIEKLSEFLELLPLLNTIVECTPVFRPAKIEVRCRFANEPPVFAGKLKAKRALLESLSNGMEHIYKKNFVAIPPNYVDSKLSTLHLPFNVLQIAYIALTNDNCDPALMKQAANSVASYNLLGHESDLVFILFQAQQKDFAQTVLNSADAMAQHLLHNTHLAEVQKISLLLTSSPPVTTRVASSYNQTRHGDSNTLMTVRGAAKSWKNADEYIHSLVGIPLTIEHLERVNLLLRGVGGGDSGLRTDGFVTAGFATTTSAFYIAPQYVVYCVTIWLKWLNEAMQQASRILAYPHRMLRYIEIANDAYAWLVSIHAFGDGNGRTSKLVGDFVLMSGGLPPIAWTGKYAMFAAPLIRGEQKPIPWKKETFEKTLKSVLKSVINWHTHMKKARTASGREIQELPAE